MKSTQNPPNSLKKKLQKGAIWTAFGQFGSAFLQWAQVAALAWLLPPADFGAMAVAQTAAGFAAPLAEIGLFQAVLYQKDLTDRQRSTLFWANLGLGCGFFAAFLALGPAFSDWFRAPRLAALMGWVGCVFLLQPFGAERAALLAKNFEFETISRLEMGGRAASLAVSVAAAWVGWGPFSLAAGHLARHVFLLLGNRFFGQKFDAPTVERGFFWRETKPLLRLGLFESAARWASFAQANADKFIVGRWLGMAELGFYQLAWSLAVAPISFILPALSRLAGPVFAKIQAEKAKKLPLAYADAMILAAAAMFPAHAFLAVAAPEIVAVFFGKCWSPVAPVLAVMAVAWAARSMGVLGTGLLMARRRPELELFWNLGFGLFSSAMIVGFLTIWPAAEAVAWAHLAAILSVGWLRHFWTARLGGVDYGLFWADLAKIAAVSALSAAAVWPLGRLEIGFLPLLSMKFLLGFSLVFFGLEKLGTLKKIKAAL